MQLETVGGGAAEISDAEILRAAGRIYAGRRKVHAGAPRKLRECRWCRTGIEGRRELERHERECAQRPAGGYAPITVDDIARMAWRGPASGREP
jgi:hypothetical protein